jgi:hypothetical protein
MLLDRSPVSLNLAGEVLLIVGIKEASKNK